MTSDHEDGQPLTDCRGALAAAIRDNNWCASPISANRLRLSGHTLDGDASIVTDVYVLPATVGVESRLPVQLSPSQRLKGMLLGSAINAACGSAVTFECDCVPLLVNRIHAIQPEPLTVNRITLTIRMHRGLAKLASAAYADLARGVPLSTVATGCKIADFLPFAVAPIEAAVLDTTLTPQPTTKALAAFKALRIPQAEALALARVATLSESHSDAEPCAGPLVSHADGVVECYGCTNPLHRVHGRGTTASCGPGRRLGEGHHCKRCDVPLGIG